MVIKLSAVLVALAAMMGNVESIGLTKGDGKMGKANTTIPTMLLEGQRSTMRREGKIATNYAIEAGSANYGLGLCDPAHESILVLALHGVGLISDTNYDGAEQLPYLRGVFWNDDPDLLLFEGNDETSEEGEHSTGAVWYAEYLHCESWGILTSSSLCQSHFYYNQFLHGMAFKACMCPDEAISEIMDWCEFTYRAALASTDTGAYNACTVLRYSNLGKAPYLDDSRNTVIEEYMWLTIGGLFGSPRDGIDHCTDDCETFSYFTNGYGCEMTGKASHCKEAESGAGTVETSNEVCGDFLYTYKGCGCKAGYTSDEDANCLQCVGDTVPWSQNVHKRALGSLAHTIMDSYAAAHTVRIDENMITSGGCQDASTCSYPEGSTWSGGPSASTDTGGSIRSFFGEYYNKGQYSNWRSMTEGHKNVGKIVSVSTYQGQSDSRHKYYDSLTEGYSKDLLADGYVVDVEDIRHAPGAWESEMATFATLRIVRNGYAWQKTNGQFLYEHGGELLLRTAIFRLNDGTDCTDKATTYNDYGATLACQLPSGPGIWRDSVTWPNGAQTSIKETQCVYRQSSTVSVPCTCAGDGGATGGPNGAGYALPCVGATGCVAAP